MLRRDRDGGSIYDSLRGHRIPVRVEGSIVAGGVLKRTILDPLLTPIVRPATRYTVRFLAVPCYRVLRRRLPWL